MTSRRALAFGAALLGLLLGAPALSAGDPAEGRYKAQTCLGCHGVPAYENVYPSYKVPKIAGQHSEYLVAALKAYKSGARQHATMRAQASTLSEEDMQDIAAYFESLGPAQSNAAEQ